MTGKRKAQLFDKAISWIFGQLAYADKLTYEETLEEIGCTDEEIAEMLKDIIAEDEG